MGYHKREIRSSKLMQIFFACSLCAPFIRRI